MTMTVETAQYYDNLLEMFSQEGWNDYIEDLNKMNKALIQNASIDCETNDQWQYRRGQLEILNYILNFESLANNALDTLESDVAH